MIAAAPMPPSAAAPPVLRLPARRKLVPLEFFATLHGFTLRSATNLIDSRELWPAFNVAVLADGRRNIRVFRQAVENYSPDRASLPPSEIGNIIASILPPLGVADASKSTVRAVELAFRWCMIGDSVASLISAGEMKEVGSHSPVNESPRVAYASAVAFLQRRLI